MTKKQEAAARIYERAKAQGVTMRVHDAMIEFSDNASPARTWPYAKGEMSMKAKENL